MASAKGFVPPACEKGSRRLRQRSPCRARDRLVPALHRLSAQRQLLEAQEKGETTTHRCPWDLLGRGKSQKCEFTANSHHGVSPQQGGRGRGARSCIAAWPVMPRPGAVAGSRALSWKQTLRNSLLLLTKGPNQPQAETQQAAKPLPSHAGTFATRLSQEQHCPVPRHHSSGRNGSEQSSSKCKTTQQGEKTAPVVHPWHWAAELAAAAQEGGLGITAGRYPMMWAPCLEDIKKRQRGGDIGHGRCVAAVTVQGCKWGKLLKYFCYSCWWISGARENNNNNNKKIMLLGSFCQAGQAAAKPELRTGSLRRYWEKDRKKAANTAESPR